MNCKMSILIPNTLCPTSSPAIEVMGLITDANRVANHYFGETVVVPRTGRKPTIGQTRNELAWIVGLGDTKNGAWLVQRYERPSGVLVERYNPQSVLQMSEIELNKLTGHKWIPVTRPDGVVHFKCRADARTVNTRSGDPWEGEIDVSTVQRSLESSWCEGDPVLDKIGFERSADIKGDYHMFEPVSRDGGESADESRIIFDQSRYEHDYYGIGEMS